MAKTISEREAAKLLRASLAAVQDRRKSGGLSLSVSRDAKGRCRYDPALVAGEWQASTPLRAGGMTGNALQAWREARTRREAAMASLAEDELRRRRGELIEVAEVATTWHTLVGRARNKLLGVPAKLRQRRPELNLVDLAAVDQLIRESLEDLANNAEAQGAADGQ
jgi:phage terminase Nu1 subunit (DNA packaging protein)